jgi:hypothetical protein
LGPDISCQINQIIVRSKQSYINVPTRCAKFTAILCRPAGRQNSRWVVRREDTRGIATICLELFTNRHRRYSNPRKIVLPPVCCGRHPSSKQTRSANVSEAAEEARWARPGRFFRKGARAAQPGRKRGSRARRKAYKVRVPAGATATEQTVNQDGDTATGGDLALYELQKPLVEPLLRMFRLTNTTLDMLFYDVAAFTAEMFRRGSVVDAHIRAGTGGHTDADRNPLLNRLDLGALTNPEGSILVVDARQPPYVQRFDDMTEFLAHANGPSAQSLRSVSITGVGSSALGSAAFAWNASSALGEPVAAIIPGYGLADVVPQALGGWFGLGLHDWLQSTTQSFLAAAAPSLAQIGRQLARSSPRHARAPSGAPVFEHGSAASDDLHGVLQDAPRIARVIGHSKGALAIANALRSLPPERTRDIAVVTFGCAIAEELKHCGYTQFLGVLDGLGALNSWGHQPEQRPLAHHSTNSFIPLSLPVPALVERFDGAARGDGSKGPRRES